MNILDYKDIPDRNDRKELAIAQAAEMGVERDKAYSLLGMTPRECDTFIITRRPVLDQRVSGGLDGVCDLRTVVGIEWGNWETFEWPISAQKNVAFLTFLSQFGWVGDHNGKPTGQGEIKQGNSNAQAIAFEWMLTHNAMDIKDVFSLGPTQVHLKWGGTHGVPGTAEEMWNAYAVNNAGDAFNAIHYLSPQYSVNGAPYPVDESYTPAVQFLKNQAGSCAEEYYYGSACSFVAAVPNFKSWLQAYKDARSIGDGTYY